MAKRIRSITLSDADAVCRIYAPFVTDRATSFEAVAPDATEMQHRIKDLTTQYPWLVFESEGDVLGYAYASTHRTRHAYQWCTEVSVYIDERAHKRGIARALYTALFGVLRRQGYFNAYAGITLPNEPSVALHQALGFKPIGTFANIGFKFGTWHDVMWLDLRLLDERVPLHDPPLPAGVLLGNDDVLSLFNACAQTVRTN